MVNGYVTSVISILLVGRVNVGRVNGYHCLKVSTEEFMLVLWMCVLKKMGCILTDAKALVLDQEQIIEKGAKVLLRTMRERLAV